MTSIESIDDDDEPTARFSNSHSAALSSLSKRISLTPAGKRARRAPKSARSERGPALALDAFALADAKENDTPRSARLRARRPKRAGVAQALAAQFLSDVRDELE